MAARLELQERLRTRDLTRLNSGAGGGDTENILDRKENKWISEIPGKSYNNTSDDRAETEANIFWARSDQGGRFGKFIQ